MSGLMGSGINSAVIDYKMRRLYWKMAWYDMGRGNYIVDLVKDIAILVINIIWAFIAPLVYMLVMLVIYLIVSVAMIFLFFYLLSRMI